MSIYKNKTIKALSWNFSTRIVSQILSVCFGICLARLLSPSDFGLMAMSLVFIGLASLFGDIGLGAALIQREVVEEKHYSSVFWINTSVACLMTLVFFLFAHVIADFYGKRELENIVKILAFNFIISALALVPRVKFTKELKFKELGVVDLMAMITANIIAIFLALMGAAVWALVVQIVAIQLVSTVLIWKYSAWLPQKIFSMQAIKDLFGFSLYVFLTTLFRYAATSTDKLLIGKFIGTEQLGYYDKAHSMMLAPIATISQSIGSVMFPSFSAIKNDVHRVKVVYLKIIAAISFITFPLLMGMIGVADSFVLGVLGTKWEAMIFLLRMFCAIGVVLSIVTVTGAIYMSQGKSKIQFKVNLVTQTVQIISLMVGMIWGVEGVVIGFVTANSIGALITWKVAGSLIGVTLIDIFKALLPAFVISLLMLLVVCMCGLYLAALSPLARLFVQVGVGGMVYVVVVFLVKPSVCMEMVEVVKTKL